MSTACPTASRLQCLALEGRYNVAAGCPHLSLRGRGLEPFTRFRASFFSYRKLSPHAIRFPHWDLHGRDMDASRAFPLSPALSECDSLDGIDDLDAFLDAKGQLSRWPTPLPRRELDEDLEVPSEESDYDSEDGVDGKR